MKKIPSPEAFAVGAGFETKVVDRQFRQPARLAKPAH